MTLTGFGSFRQLCRQLVLLLERLLPLLVVFDGRVQRVQPVVAFLERF